MYTSINFKTKKQLKEAVAAGQAVLVYQPSYMFNIPTPINGTVAVEGPWYPQPHSWYAQVILKDGITVKVK